MVLLSAVIAGAVTGWGYARWQGRTWHPPVFRSVWLVFLGFLPQLAAIYLPSTRRILSDDFASSGLIISQLLLLFFSLINIRIPGMAILALGLGLNLVVIVMNGGFMPLPLETAEKFVNPRVLSGLEIGERIDSSSKDVLLPESEIVLPWLADRFVSPKWLSYRFAFSAGDIFVAAGAFWMLSGLQPALSGEK